MKKLVALMVALTMVLGLAAVASAADYPSKGISVICPWSAGGGTDNCLRAFCSALEKQLGVSVTVDNQTGASGVTGHEAIADADPDGYTIGMITFELATYKPSDMSDYTYENYDAICRINTDAAAVTVNAKWAADNGITDLATFVDYCKAHPGEVRWAVSTLPFGTRQRLPDERCGHRAADDSLSGRRCDRRSECGLRLHSGRDRVSGEARNFIESGHLICAASRTISATACSRMSRPARSRATISPTRPSAHGGAEVSTRPSRSACRQPALPRLSPDFVTFMNNGG
ncbi:MAG: Bug family tripartite tricarboxylate transporter substrate binding protein [Christensenellales bacterium]